MKINGTAVRVIRERSGVSGAQFASACGISPQHLSDIELGNRNASADVITRIAEQLVCPITAILGPEPVPAT